MTTSSGATATEFRAPDGQRFVVETDLIARFSTIRLLPDELAAAGTPRRERQGKIVVQTGGGGG